jgi:FtsP/CotA-like multicopper oxidase with cupredoxin domain
MPNGNQMPGTPIVSSSSPPNREDMIEANVTSARIRVGPLWTMRAQYDLPTGVTTPQTYVYHCHILEHEDNDMMRPFTISA